MSQSTTSSVKFPNQRRRRTSHFIIQLQEDPYEGWNEVHSFQGNLEEANDWIKANYSEGCSYRVLRVTRVFDTAVTVKLTRVR